MRFRARFLLPALLASGVSCNVARTAVEAPGRLVGAMIPGQKPAPPSAEALLSDLMRYADLVVERVDEASRSFEQDAGTREAELLAARWRIETQRIVTQLATGPNSLSGLLDVVTYVMIFGWLVEDQFQAELGPASASLRTAFEQSQQDGWSLLERHLPAAEFAGARALVDEWRTAHPRLEREILLEFPSFTALASERRAEAGASASLLGLVGLDPLSGLEPAARQIEEARLFGLRALYFLQRAPRLVAAETEFRVLGVRGSPEVRQLLADSERITRTLEEFQATAATLPAALSTEREAALAQVAAELSAQRAGLLADLAEAQAPLEGVLGETRAALEAGERMSAELTKTLAALDGFVGRFDEPAAEAAAPAEPSAPAKPFDITEYGATAGEVARAAAELNALVVALDERLPEAERLLDEAAARGQATVDRAFWRALELGLALIAAGALAVLCVRRLGRSPPRAG
jgi:hypothetical protein